MKNYATIITVTMTVMIAVACAASGRITIHSRLKRVRVTALKR